MASWIEHAQPLLEGVINQHRIARPTAKPSKPLELTRALASPPDACCQLTRLIKVSQLSAPPVGDDEPPILQLNGMIDLV
jgi:hypothetical protein